MDLFAGLDGLGSASNKKVSLAEQRRLQDQNNLKTVLALEGLDSLGGGSPMAPIPKQQTSKPKIVQQNNPEEDDLFGIFNSAPAPNPLPSKAAASRSNLESNLKNETDQSTTSYSSQRSFSDKSRASDLSLKLPRPSASTSTSAPRTSRAQTHSKVSDHAIAQLVDMGFEPEVSKKALEAMNGSVKGAVNWIMADAQGLPLPEPRSRGLSSTIGNGDFSEFQAAATQIGSSMLSKASVLFSKGRKEIEKAYNNYNNQYMGDPSQPAWMKDKARHDAKSNSGLGLELPGRPAQRASPGPEPEPPSRPQQQPTSNEPRTSRAELFRQRQKARNGGSTQTSAFQSSPRDTSLDSPLPTPMDSPLETPSAPSSVRSTKDSTPDTIPEIDLLNLSSSSSDQVALSATEQDLYATSRELGSEAFRKGDFEGAITHYSSALQVIPESHLLRALLYSNRSAAYLKAGNLRGAFDDTTKGISIIPLRKKGEKLDEKGTSMSDIWVKLVTRNAQAAESMEKFDAALSSWQLLLDNGYASSPVLDAKRRCLKALSPEEQVKQKAASEPALKKPQRRGWGTTGAAPTSAEGKAALEKVKASHTKQADEERQKDLLRDKVSIRVDNWQRGNEKNLRALLSTLQNVLWESCDWQPVELSDLVIPKKVRNVYMKAVARTHPDKVPSTAPVEVRMVSQSVFVVIQGAWEVFRQENNL